MIDKYRLDDLRLESGEKGELARWVIQLQRDLDSERRKAGNSPVHSGLSPAQNVVSPAQIDASPTPGPIDHGYRHDCECAGCKATARICADLAGWIPVSERLPEKNGMYQVWNGKHMAAHSFFFGSFQCINPEQITHWMPLPAAPQEVKP